ncbi:MAG: acyltransferase, partial [Bacteroidota bacterium]|nr:acyltransferase [Bacteroidota bacterium]
MIKALPKLPAPVYFRALTGLRMVAASLVFWYHFQDKLSPTLAKLLAPFLAHLHTGVSLFFILSGFLIAHRYQEMAFDSLRSYGTYFAKRLWRIWPVYGLILAVLHTQWLFTLPQLLLHASLLMGFFKKLNSTGVMQAWSLTVELTFYALAPLLFQLIRKFSYWVTLGLTFLTGLLLTGAGFLLTQFNLNSLEFMPDFLFMAWQTFFGRSPEFFAGMYLAQVVRSGKHLPFFLPSDLPITYAGIILFILSTCLLSLTTGIHHWPGLLLHHVLMPLSGFLWLTGLIREKTMVSKILSTRLFIVLGNASYAFYLIHIGWVRNWLERDVTSSVLLLFIMLWVI